jgi:uncharacterized membrane protein YfhO
MLISVFIIIYKNNKEKFTKAISFSLIGVILLYSTVFIALGKSHSYESDFILDQCINAGNKIQIEDDSFYRVDEFEGMDNTATFWGYKSVRFFHSCVSPSIMEFYPTVGVKRDVSSKPDFNLYTLRAFLSVKYVFANLEKDNQPTTLGLIHLYNKNGYAVYLNTNAINMGFTYENYITEEEYYELDETAREKILTSVIVLNSEQTEKYGHLLNHISLYDLDYTYNGFVNECALRNNNSCYEFIETKRGFYAKINSERNNLLFFSVPYDKGFKAYVNGVETEIEKVTVGFSAVKIPEGNVQIEFVYTPYGLNAGLIATISSILVLISYLVISKHLRKRGAFSVAEEEK